MEYHGWPTSLALWEPVPALLLTYLLVNVFLSGGILVAVCKELILMLLFVLFAAVYLVIAELIPSSSSLTIGVMVLVQQLFMLNRLGFRVFAFAGESALFLELNPDGGGIPGWEMGHIGDRGSVARCLLIDTLPFSPYIFAEGV
jgi:hypothetical protein